MKKNKKHYFLIGICGISMSGLAKLLIAEGNEVSGSDIKDCYAENDKKIKVYIGHDEKHITKDIDEVIYTSAITEDSRGYVELKKAKDLGIKTTKRSKMIGQLMNNKIGIAVAGMHGKTTTTAMISLILEAANYDPTCLVGSFVKEWKSNARAGQDKYFVAEACEYDRQMLDFRPHIALITNIEEEHLDTYPGGLKEIKQAFKKFIKLLPKNGLLVMCADDKNVMSLKKHAKCKVKIYTIKKPWPGLKLKIPGNFNVSNATAAARIAHELGIKNNIIKQTLNNFTGATRRLEIKGEKKGIVVIDDYGHHPTEIKKTLAGVKEKYPNKRLIVVYQPHQQQRTKLLFNDFITSFDKADKIIMNDVYLIAGREKNTKDNLAKQLTQEIKKRGKDVKYIKDYDDIVKYLQKETKKGDLILTMGATDIYKVGENFLES